MNRMSVVAACAIAAGGALTAGGWATVSIENAPDYLAAGKPTALTLRIRQHGARPLGGLKPEMVARSGGREVAGRVWETPTAGTYRAAITVPSAGEWTLHIASGFGASSGQTLPWSAVESPDRQPPLAAYDRGRMTFASRGCVSCHVHGAVAVAGQLSSTGPELTNRRFAADYLAKFLADPSIKPKSPSSMEMPNPELQPREIAALVAFLNGERAQRASR
jgi:hypothetical protein